MEELFQDNTDTYTGLFSNTPLLLSLSSDSASISPADSSLPENLGSFSAKTDGIDTSDAVLWNMNNGNNNDMSISSETDNQFNLFPDDSFQLADCSTSGSLPIIDKFHLQRRDDSKCTNSNPTLPSMIPLEIPPVDLGLDALDQFF